MKTSFLFLFINFVSFYSIAQTTLLPRKSFVVENNKTIIKEGESQSDFSFLSKKKYENKKIFNKYIYSVFSYSTKDSKKVYYLKQWNTPIIIFLDKKIPEKIISNFKNFIKQLKGIDNLSIKFTKNIEESNYLVKITKEELYSYGKKHKFKNAEKQTHPLSNLTYNLLTDKNNKFYACTLLINDKELVENSFLEKKLKQIFYLSLGNFVVRHNDKTSLLGIDYINKNNISNTDLDFLRIHYGIIYEQKINGTTFNELIRIANKNE